MFDHPYQRTRGNQLHLPPITLSRMSVKERRYKAIKILLPALVFAGVFVFPGYFLLAHAKTLARDLCPGSGTPVHTHQGQQTSRGRHFSSLGQGISIDLSFGNLDFTIAKSLDIAWDIIVGRGVQLLLLWIAHKVYIAVLDHVIETSSVGYDFYLALALDAKPWDTTVAVANHILATRHHLLKILFIFYSVVYIAIFPSLMSAMTGYTNYTSPYIVFPDDSMIPLEDFSSNIESFGSYLLFNGTRYPSDFEMTACLNHPSGRYAYGFSKLFWEISCGLHIFWIFGMYALWVDTLLKCQLYQAGHRIGKLRAVLDLSEALNEDLGPDTCAYTGAKLRAELSRTKPRLTYYQTRKGSPVQIGLSSQMAEQPIDLDDAQGKLFGKKPGNLETGPFPDLGSPGFTQDRKFAGLDAYGTEPQLDEVGLV